jgi:hypothetical protein
MNSHDTPREDEGFVHDEEEAAAAEAGAIGGPKPDYDVDDDERGERWRALEEAGQGDEDGWELAEHDLIEEASHGDERRSPEADAFTPERESDESTAVYGEPDEIDPTEVVADPDEDEDDPGAGPGISADR